MTSELGRGYVRDEAKAQTQYLQGPRSSPKYLATKPNLARQAAGLV